MDFVRGQNTPYFSWDFDFKIWFRARKVTGSFEKRAPGFADTGTVSRSPGAGDPSRRLGQYFVHDIELKQ